MSRGATEKKHITEVLKINQICLKIVTQRFLRSLTTDLYSDLNNSK